MAERGPEDQVMMVSCPAEAKEVFSGEKAIDGEGVPVPTLDDAIDHAEQVAFMLKDDNPGCAAEHERLAGWLKELRHLRLQNSGLIRRVEDLQREFREFKRNAATSMDENVHIRVEISQFSKRWMGAFEISKMVLEHIRVSEAELLLEHGTNLLRETIGGFLVERERRSWER